MDTDISGTRLSSRKSPLRTFEDVTNASIELGSPGGTYALD
jgi:hypothetical protein